MGFDRDKVKLAVLWIIRERQPISFAEITSLVGKFEGNLPSFLDEILFDPSWMMRSGMHYIGELIGAGLVATVDGVPLERSTKLVTTTALGIVQDLFAISLKDQITRRPGGVEAHPVFGIPLGRMGQKWARVFVAMPFAAELRPIYENHILKVAEKLGVSCKRGDDFFSTNRIMSEVWSAIYHAEVCIVDCTGRNPNVFYELGIAHTIGRKAILIAQSLEDIPFDVRDFRAIEYQFPDGMAAFETKLEQTLRAELHLQSS